MSQPERTAADRALENRALVDRDSPAASGEQVLDTGDLVIDAALRDLAGIDADDLDGHIEAAESLQRTLQGRLANLSE